MWIVSIFVAGGIGTIVGSFTGESEARASFATRLSEVEKDQAELSQTIKEGFKAISESIKDSAKDVSTFQLAVLSRVASIEGAMTVIQDYVLIEK